MATKTLYLTNTAAATPFWGSPLQDGGSAPTAATTSFGWTVAKGTATQFWKARLGASAFVASGNGQASSQIDSTSGPQKGTAATNAAAGDSFWAGPYSGTFANTAWTFHFNMRATVATAVGRIRCIVWKSANADGTSATKLSGGTTLNNAGTPISLSSTTTDVDCTFTWSPGTITLNNEYLFFQVEWAETTTGSSTSTALGFRVGVGSNSVTSSIVTPDFQDNAVTSQTLAALTQTLRGTTVGGNTLDPATNPDSSRLILSGGNLTLTRGVDNTDTPNVVGTNARFSAANQYYFEVTVNYAATSGWCSSVGLSCNNDPSRLSSSTGRNGYYDSCTMAVQSDGTFRGLHGDNTYGVESTGHATYTTGDKIGVLLKPAPTLPPTTWNTNDCEASVVLTTTGTGAYIGNISGVHNVRATDPITSGEYFEIEVTSDWSATAIGYIGLANLSASLTAIPTDANSVAYGSNGTLYSAGSSSTGGATFGTTTDVIGVLYTGTQVKFYKNGTLQYTATTLPSGSLYPIVSFAAIWQRATANFAGDMPFYGKTATLPTGATAWYGNPMQTFEIFKNGTSYGTFQIGTGGNAAHSGGGAVWPLVAVSQFTPTAEQLTVNFGASAFSYMPTASNTVSWDLSQNNAGRSAVVAQTLGALVQSATDTVLAQATIAQTLGVLGQAFAATHPDTATTSQTLGALGQTTTGQAIDSAVVAQTLGALSQVASSSSQMAITVAQNLGALTQSAAATHPDIATAAQTLGALVQSATDGVIDAATATQTLGALSQVATASAASPVNAVVNQTLGVLGQAAADTVLDAAVINQTLGALGQSAAASETVAATVAQNLGALTQSAAATHPDTAAVAQNLGALGQAATGGVIDAATAAQTLGALVQSATGGAIAAATAAQTLGALVQSLAATDPDALTAAQTLGALGQAAAASETVAATVAQNLGALTQSVTGGVVDKLTAAQTLGAIVQSTTGGVIDNATAAQTLGAIAQSAAATSPAAAAAVQTLGVLAQSATGTAPDAAAVAQILGALGQTSTGGVVDNAAVSQTLGALTQSFAATHAGTVNLTAAQTLGNLGQALTGTAVDAATVAQNLGTLGQTAAATHPDTATTAQTLGAIVQALTGTVLDQAVVTQALGALNQTATASAVSGFVAAQTLGSIVQALTGKAIDSATVAQALGGLNQTASGGVVDRIGAYSDALGPLGQAATASAPARMTVSQALGALAQVATADLPSATFATNQILGALSQIATGATSDRILANQILGALGQTLESRQARIAHRKIQGQLTSGYKLKGQVSSGTKIEVQHSETGIKGQLN